MFTSLARTVLVSAAIAAGALATSSAPAAADGVRFNITVGVPVHGHVRDQYRPVRSCTPERALRKAERLGLRRAHLQRVNRRAVVVAGRKHGERAVVRFARAGGNCPVISYR